MSNPCVKTGANVWLESEDAVFHGDLYAVAEMWVFRYRDMPIEMHRDESDMIMLTAQAQNLSDASPDCTPDIMYLDGNYRTVIIAQQACRCSDELVAYMSAGRQKFFDVLGDENVH